MTQDQYILIYYVAVFCAGFIIGLTAMALKSKATALKDMESLKMQLSGANALNEKSMAELDEIKNSYLKLQEKNKDLEIELARLQETFSSYQEKLNWQENAKKQMADAFENMANRTFEYNSRAFLNHAKEYLGDFMDKTRGDWNTQKAQFKTIVEPIKQNIETLESHVRELEQKREGAYEGLKEQLRQLSVAHGEIYSAAVNLKQALKSPVTRGRWGEIQLRRIVEISQMMPHVDFTEQKMARSGRPDMIVRLPHGGILPIDSKVPLKAYLEAMDLDDDKIKKQRLKEHAKAMKNRIRELGQKKYWEQFNPSPDFVVMFIPNEGSIAAAFEIDPDLIEFAFEHRILMASPISLIGLLKAVAYGWRQHRMNENAKNIIGEGRELYKRLDVFANRLAELQTCLARSVEGFNKVVGSFQSRLMPIAKKFGEMSFTGEELNPPDTINVHVRDVAQRKL